MTNNNKQVFVPKCCLAHHLINKMSVIAGSCELIVERLEFLGWKDASCVERLGLIRREAEVAVKELNVQLCPCGTVSIHRNI